MNATLSRGRLMLAAETAADLMRTDPVSVRADARADEVLDFLSHRGISAAPVVNDAGRPIGVLSRTDLLAHRHNVPDPDRLLGANPRVMDVRAEHLMTPAVFAVAPSTPASRVVADLLGLNVHRLFVVDDDGVLVGVITPTDVMRKLQAISAGGE